MKTNNLEEVRLAMETYYEEVLAGPSVCMQDRKLLSCRVKV